jgi:DNA-binding transcriptional ArsR family regulator
MGILSILKEGEASPTELSDELDLPLGNVSYHVRILASSGLIKLVRQTPRRGSVESHYALSADPTISDETWDDLPEGLKQSIVGPKALQAIMNLKTAAGAGGFFRREAQLWEIPLRLDDEGWRQLADEIHACREKISEIKSQAEERTGTTEDDGESAMVQLVVFEHSRGRSKTTELESSNGNGATNSGEPQAESATAV